MPVLIRLLNIAKSPGMNTGLGMTNFGANLINKKSNRMDFCDASVGKVLWNFNSGYF